MKEKTKNVFKDIAMYIGGGLSVLVLIGMSLALPALFFMCDNERDETVHTLIVTDKYEGEVVRSRTKVPAYYFTYTHRATYKGRTNTTTEYECVPLGLYRQYEVGDVRKGKGKTYESFTNPLGIAY